MGSRVVGNYGAEDACFPSINQIMHVVQVGLAKREIAK